jgi:signal transduction histidine kinase
MRLRILFAIVGVVFLMLLLLGVPLGLAVRQRYEDQEFAVLVRKAAAATIAVDTAEVRGDPHAFDPTHGTVRFALYNAKAQKVLGTGPTQGDAVVHEALTGQVSNSKTDEGLVAAVPVAEKESVVGVVRVRESDSVLDDRVHRTWVFMTIAGVIALAIASILAAWLSRTLGRPIESLARAATRLGEGDFAVRVPRSGFRELDDVASSLEGTASRIDAALARERAFSADASHQLRTPLTALRAQLEAADLGATDPRVAIHDALEQADRLEATIDSLLALARDAHGTRELLHIPELLERPQREWRRRLSAEHRELRIEVDDDVPPVRASSAAAREILDVLVDNAIGHGAGTVIVRARTVAGGLSLEVEDQGPGIVDNGQLFARRTAANQGHGIGLALARSLAEAEGGRLLLQRAGAHPQFAWLLPAATDAAPEPLAGDLFVGKNGVASESSAASAGTSGGSDGRRPASTPGGGPTDF